MEEKKNVDYVSYDAMCHIIITKMLTATKDAADIHFSDFNLKNDDHNLFLALGIIVGSLTNKQVYLDTHNFLVRFANKKFANQLGENKFKLGQLNSTTIPVRKFADSIRQMLDEKGILEGIAFKDVYREYYKFGDR